MNRKIPLILLCMLFLCMAGYGGVRLFSEWNEYRAGEDAYEQLAQYVNQDASLLREGAAADMGSVSSALTDTIEREQDLVGRLAEIDWPVVDFEALRTINPDIVAWVFIEGTNINYPVVQGSDNSYYLNHLFDGSYNGAGTIFMDYRNECELTDRNTVIYGHHMQNGTMFNQITKYKDQSFYDEHPIGLMITPHENYVLEFIAGYVTDLNDDAWKMEFASDEEYVLWLEDAVSKSTFSSTASPAAQERTVTFSTCTYEYNEARFVLVGILKS